MATPRPWPRCSGYASFVVGQTLFLLGKIAFLSASIFKLQGTLRFDGLHLLRPLPEMLRSGLEAALGTIDFGAAGGDPVRLAEFESLGLDALGVLQPGGAAKGLLALEELLSRAGVLGASWQLVRPLWAEHAARCSGPEDLEVSQCLLVLQGHLSTSPGSLRRDTYQHVSAESRVRQHIPALGDTMVFCRSGLLLQLGRFKGNLVDPDRTWALVQALPPVVQCRVIGLSFDMGLFGSNATADIAQPPPPPQQQQPKSLLPGVQGLGPLHHLGPGYRGFPCCWVLLARDPAGTPPGSVALPLPAPMAIPIHIDGSTPDFLIPAAHFHASMSLRWHVGSRLKLPTRSKDGSVDKITGQVRRILVSRDRARDLEQEREARAQLRSIRRDELAWLRAERVANADKPGASRGGRKKIIYDDDDVDSPLFKKRVLGGGLHLGPRSWAAYLNCSCLIRRARLGPMAQPRRPLTLEERQSVFVLFVRPENLLCTVLGDPRLHHGGFYLLAADEPPVPQPRYNDEGQIEPPSAAAVAAAGVRARLSCGAFLVCPMESAGGSQGVVEEPEAELEATDAGFQLRIRGKPCSRGAGRAGRWRLVSEHQPSDHPPSLGSFLPPSPSKALQHCVPCFVCGCLGPDRPEQLRHHQRRAGRAVCCNDAAAGPAAPSPLDPRHGCDRDAGGCLPPQHCRGPIHRPQQQGASRRPPRW